MRYESLEALLRDGAAVLAKGPIALIFVEDLVEAESTIRHHFKLRFAQIIVFAPDELNLPMDVTESIVRVTYTMQRSGALQAAVNAVNDAAIGVWLYYCYNAEYLFYPFCEDRSIGEMLAFHTEERRDALLSYVVDLYAADLNTDPNAVNLEEAHMDRSGYYALARPDEKNHPRERQLNFYGGLRWRFEEHIPPPKRKIDRISIFRAAKDLRLREDLTFNDEEYNTYSCPWHHNITAAVCSFRTAKALRTNAGSMFEINGFVWHNSVKFDWHSQQLLDLGLMEPGQWF